MCRSGNGTPGFAGNLKTGQRLFEVQFGTRARQFLESTVGSVRMAGGDLEYLSVDDVLTLHETIVRADDSTEPGVSTPGDIEYTVTTVREGHFDEGPETIHEKSATLLRLLTANHPFVDGNKRTALVSTVAFYAVNGYALDYGNEIRSLLKRLATDVSAVSTAEVVAYLESNASELPPARETKYHEYLSIASARSPRRNGYTDEEGT